MSTLYPKRNLRVIGIPFIDDLFNLRNVVEIKKESRVLRTIKFVRKQSAAIILLILLAVVIFFSGLLDFDTNPAKILRKGRFLYVINKNEKVLWKKFLYYGDSFGGEGLLRISAKLFDINSDGNNEVIVANEADTSKSNYGAFIPRITCYDHSGDTVWTYEFKDTISTRTKKFLPHYEPSLINIINRDGRNILYCFARQYQYYPGVIFSIDVKTGKRIGNTFWHPGRFTDAHLGDFNRDGKPEIVAVGAQNSYEGNFILSINLDELDGCGPATPDYHFYGKKTSKFNKYVLIPLTDLAKHLDLRYANIDAGGLDYVKSTNSFRVDAIETAANNFGVMLFVFDSKLNLLDIDCSDGMQMIRDSLVVHGELNKPLTNTPEYFKSLRKQFQYWDGEKFISYQSYNNFISK